MNKHAGKARIGVIAFVAAAAFAIVGLHGSSGRADPTPTPAPLLYVTDGQTNAVTAYPAASNGDLSPIATITGLRSPQGIAQDSSGNIYVVNDSPASVVVYPAGSTGDAAPSATISGPDTGLKDPLGIAVDSSGNIYVTDTGNNSCGGPARVFVYPAGSTGNVPPIATISSSAMSCPTDITLDSSDNIYVADANGVLVYAAGSTGDATPTAIIPAGGATDQLTYPIGIALDSSGNIYVTAYYFGGVFVYSAGSNGDVPPIANLPGYGANDGLLWPYGIAVDSSGNIYVADLYAASVFVYPPGSTGDVAPVSTISGSQTELYSPMYIALLPGAASPAATPTPATVISVNASLAFGKQPVGVMITKYLTVKNTGREVLFVTSVSSSDPLELAAGASTCPSAGIGLAPGSTCTTMVSFTPGASGKRGATLTLHDNAGRGEQKVALSGTGLADVAVSPDRIAYGKVKLSAKKSKKVQVKNAQPVAVDLSQIITGTNAGDFTVTGGTCAATLAAKSKCAYIVTFTPGGAGTRSATLNVTASPDPQSPYNVSLTGAGS
ncbi:MAG: choice-of-anchor D domain-containing protein [Candidatus Binatus sp.]|uniref:choice-of-anchor D domain-containing protein n=1 Tax=Candidatus Binatus sp. TaxID=2811406 RepID=UPI003C788E3E